MKKKIFIPIFAILIVVILGFYLGDIIVNSTSPKEHLFEMLSSLVICLGSLIKLVTADRTRKSLAFYETQYADILENSFKNAYWDRRKLLCAVRLYNEDRYQKALKYLHELQPRCQCRADEEGVGMFLALTYTDMACYAEAAQAYSQMISAGIYSSRIYSNLGHVYSKMGQYEDAIANMHLALQNDQRNAFVYQNLAALYFETYDFEKAIQYAKEALTINCKFRQAATLLAIIYALQENQEEAKKYAHIAISAGENPVDIKRGIEHYRESYNLAVMDSEDE